MKRYVAVVVTALFGALFARRVLPEGEEAAPAGPAGAVSGMFALAPLERVRLCDRIADGRVELVVRWEPLSVLAVRVRADGGGVRRGATLLVGTHPSVPTRFHEEDGVLWVPIGRPGDEMRGAPRARRLVVLFEGKMLRAEVDGVTVTAAETGLTAPGAVELEGVRGTSTVESARWEARNRRASVLWRELASAAVAAALLFSVLAAGRGHPAPCAVSVVAAFSSVILPPLPPATRSLLGSLLAVGCVLPPLLTALARSSRLSTPRRLALLAGSVGLAFLLPAGLPGVRRCAAPGCGSGRMEEAVAARVHPHLRTALPPPIEPGVRGRVLIGRRSGPAPGGVLDMRRPEAGLFGTAYALQELPPGVSEALLSLDDGMLDELDRIDVPLLLDEAFSGRRRSLFVRVGREWGLAPRASEERLVRAFAERLARLGASREVRVLAPRASRLGRLLAAAGVAVKPPAESGR